MFTYTNEDNLIEKFEQERQFLINDRIEALTNVWNECHHEIKTPLMIISMYINQVHSMQDLEKYKLIANNQITRLLQIIDSLMILSVPPQTIKKQKTNCNINDLMNTTIELLPHIKSNVTLQLNTVPNLFANASDLICVFTNIINNSKDFGGDKVKICISTQQVKNKIVIKITDNGPGISPEIINKIWDPFFTTKIAINTGLGLSIAHKLISEHNGTISIETNTNIGATFIIKLPIEDMVQ